jgi:hypothetical protein
VFDECRRVVDRVEREDRDVDLAGEVAVVGQVPDGGRIGGEALGTRVEGLVVMGAGVANALVAEGVTAAEAVVDDVAEGEGGEAQVGLQGALRDLRDGEDVIEIALLLGGSLLRGGGEAGALLEAGAQTGTEGACGKSEDTTLQK